MNAVISETAAAAATVAAAAGPWNNPWAQLVPDSPAIERLLSRHPNSRNLSPSLTRRPSLSLPRDGLNKQSPPPLPLVPPQQQTRGMAVQVDPSLTG
jgi:hypothetical protein